MGLFDRFVRSRESKRAEEARARELAGDLQGAVQLYLQAEMPDEAARVLLLRADATTKAEQRIGFCDGAARVAQDPELRKQALARKALITFDLLKARGVASLRHELSRVAKDLEEAGELERAVEAYGLAGDGEAEVRVLTEMGAIEQLEERLRKSNADARKVREKESARRKITDLDRVAERRAALAAAQAALALAPDETVEEAAQAIRARLATAPVVDLVVDGTMLRCALGEAVTLGRGDAEIVVASRAVSRQHVRIRREGAGVVIEDLGTRNGTTLAGARIDGPMPVGEGISVALGGEVTCVVSPAREGVEASVAPGGVIVEVAGGRYVAPLGPLVVGPWRVERAIEGDEVFLILRTPPGAPRPVMGEFELAERVELCVGDEIRASRGGPVRLVVKAGAGGPGGLL